MEKEDVLILAIESSCDETAAAVVKTAGQFYQILFLPRSIFISFMEESCRKSLQENILKK